MKKNFIQIKKVSKIYKNKFEALKNIDLNIQEGEIFALLGPNGAGKSTLINVLCGITYHSKGDIFITTPNLYHAGVDARRHIPHRRGRGYGCSAPSNSPSRGE